MYIIDNYNQPVKQIYVMKAYDLSGNIFLCLDNVVEMNVEKSVYRIKTTDGCIYSVNIDVISMVNCTPA